jgi:hypothetical protein
MSFEKKTLLHTVRRALSLCAVLTVYPYLQIVHEVAKELNLPLGQQLPFFRVAPFYVLLILNNWTDVMHIMYCTMYVHVQYISLYAVGIKTHCQRKLSNTIKYTHSAQIAYSNPMLA